MDPQTTSAETTFDLEADLALAHQVQTSFLPQHPPTVAGIDIYAAHKFAHQVGGDFYDFLPGSSQNFLFTIGDISYKGISAALMMSVLRKVLRTAAETLADPSPSEILRYANRSMYEELSTNSMFATAVVGDYRAGSGYFTISNAGHAPVLYRPHNGTTKLLEAKHVPIGVMDDEDYSEQRVRLERNDLLVLLTDGYLERQNSLGTLFGYENVIRSIERTAHKSAQEIAQAIYERFSKTAYGAQSYDDQALLIIKGV